MTKADDDVIDAYIAASLSLLAIDAAAEWLPTIRANLIATRQAAALVEEFHLPDDVDVAPVFEA